MVRGEISRAYLKPRGIVGNGGFIDHQAVEDRRFGGAQLGLGRSGENNLMQWEKDVLEDVQLHFVQQIISEEQFVEIVRGRLHPSEKEDVSLASVFNQIFSQMENKIKAEVAKIVEVKTNDIVAVVSSTMESLLKHSEVNLLSLISSKTDKSVEQQVDLVKESLAKDNQILTDELIKQDAKYTSFLTTLKKHLNSLSDAFKKGGEEAERIEESQSRSQLMVQKL